MNIGWVTRIALKRVYGSKKGQAVIDFLESDTLEAIIAIYRTRNADDAWETIPASMKEELAKRAVREKVNAMPEPGRSLVLGLLQTYAPEVMGETDGA